MIEFKTLRENDVLLWEKYFSVTQEILKRHYPEGYKADLTISAFKDLIDTNSKTCDLYRDFLVLDDNTPTGWFDCSKYDSILYCMYDLIPFSINEQELKLVLQKMLEVQKEAECSHIELVTYRKLLIDHFEGIQAPIAEKTLISRLNREDMNMSFYNQIVESSKLKELKLCHYNEIPGEIIADLVNSVNNCFDDRDLLNDIRREYPPLTIEDWYKDKKHLAERGTKLEILILFDNNRIMGFCWVCVDSFRKDVIRHNGGFTAVNREYRGKGIAKFLKAKLYIKLLEENKDFMYITTDTMPWNKYMFRINEQFGFKPYRNGCGFKLTADFLEPYLNKRD